MHELSKRQKDFIRLLLKEEEYKPILYFSKFLQVSDKTLKEDLKGIRTYLKEYQMEIFSKTGKGILISQEVKKNMDILNHLSMEENDILQNSTRNTEARRMDILKNMLVRSNMNTSIQKLSEQYYVSKASIVNDIKCLEKWLQKFNLEFEKNQEGTKIKGTESDIRKAIAFLIQKYQEGIFKNTKQTQYFGKVRLDGRTLTALLELFDLKDIIFIESLLENLEIESEIRIGDMYYINLLTHILLSIKRVQEGIHFEESKIGMIRTDTLKQYQQAQKIVEMIEKRYNLTFAEEEVYYIYQYLISSGLEEIPRVKQDKSVKLAKVLTQFISDVVGVDFQKDEEMMTGLLLHIRPMLNRLKYNIQISNPLLDEIRVRYTQMLGICQISIANLSRKFQIKEIKIDEIANIATYYQTMMVRLLTPKKVLLVCHSGYGTSQLLAAKLKHEISFINIVDVVSSRRVETMDLSGIEFIISTVPIHLKKIPFIVISALLTEEDILNIKNSMQFSRNPAFQKCYLKNLHDSITENNILVNKSIVDKEIKSRLLIETLLLPNLIIKIYEPSFEQADIWLQIEKEGSEKITVSIAFEKEEAFKNILSDLYNLSIRKEDIQNLISCNSKEEIKRFLEERAL